MQYLKASEKSPKGYLVTETYHVIGNEYRNRLKLHFMLDTVKLE